jgi:hypothetical protein
MYEKTIRLMNASERSMIEDWINPTPAPQNQSLFSRMLRSLSGETGFLARIEDSRRRSVPKFHEMLDDGHVEVHSLQPSGAVELLQSEDEGETYFFDVGDRHVFCLRHLQGGPDDDPERLRWPNTDFEIVRSRSHPWSFRQIWCRGVKLEPTRVIGPSFDLWDILPKTDIFQGTLATIEQDLESLSES